MAYSQETASVTLPPLFPYSSSSRAPSRLLNRLPLSKFQTSVSLWQCRPFVNYLTKRPNVFVLNNFCGFSLQYLDFFILKPVQCHGITPLPLYCSWLSYQVQMINFKLCTTPKIKGPNKCIWRQGKSMVIIIIMET